MAALVLGIAASYARDAAQNARVTGAAAFAHPVLDAPPLARGGRGGRLHLAYVSADWTARSAVGRALRSGIAAHRRDRVRRRRGRPAPPGVLRMKLHCGARAPRAAHAQTSHTPAHRSLCAATRCGTSAPQGTARRGATRSRLWPMPSWNLTRRAPPPCRSRGRSKRLGGVSNWVHEFRMTLE